MTSTERLAHLQEEALKLSVLERRELVRSLEASFDDDDVELAADQRAEIERRIEAIHAGDTAGLSTTEAMAQVRARLGW